MTTKIPTIELLDDYQMQAVSTFKDMDKTTALLYCSAKLAEEVGELVGPIAKNLVHGKELNLEGVTLEAGDALYYIAIIAYIYGIRLSTIATANRQKLIDRHGTAGYRQSYYIEKSESILKEKP